MATRPDPTGTARRCTRSTCRPSLPPSSPSRVRTYTMRSPFLPEIRAQSSGFVVLGRSSFSLNSSRIACVQVFDLDALLAGRQEALDRLLLRATDDVLDHGAGVEVLEVQDLLVAAGVGDLEEPVLARSARTSARPSAGSSERTSRDRSCRRRARSIVLGWIGTEACRYLDMMSAACCRSGRSILIFTSSRPGRRIAGSIRSSRFEAPITMTFLSVSTPSSSDSSCGTIVDSTSDRDSRPPRAEDRVHLVEEHDDGEALLAALLGALEDLADLALGLADVLVQELGAFDVQEVRARVVAACPLARPSRRATWRRPSRSSVLPHPGGPYSRTPFGGSSWCSANSSAYRNGSSTACWIASI